MRRHAPFVESLEPRQLLSAPDNTWKLAWSDEFNGTSLDTHKWHVGIPFGDGLHQDNTFASVVSPDDVQVSDGTLKLLTEHRDAKDHAGNTYHYTEGAIHTADTFSTAYGYFEIRAKVPVEAGRGIWAAFWMQGDHWPPEDDVAEWVTSISRTHQGLAYGSDSSVKWDDVNHYDPILTGFHTYGMEWGPGYQTFTIDARINHTARGNHVPDSSMYMLLNNAIEAAHLPDASTLFPNALEVDYVRVYKRTSVPTISNHDFDAGGPGAWNMTGDAAVVDYPGVARSGAYGLQAHTTGSAGEQLITGLSPNTRYVLSAFAKSTDPVTIAELGVRGSSTVADASGSPYAPVSVEFTTGPSATTATIFAQKASGTGYAYFDDFSIHPAAQVANGNFETGTTAGWSDAPDVGVVRGSARRGKFALREDGASAAASQVLYGLVPNTTYQLTAWAKVSGLGDIAALNVTGAGGADAQATTSSTSYTPLNLIFTTGPASTTATVSCAKVSGGGSGWFDELRLGTPVPLKLKGPKAITVTAGRAQTLRLTLSGSFAGYAPTVSVDTSDPALLHGRATVVSAKQILLTLDPTPDGSGMATVNVSITDGTGRGGSVSIVAKIHRPAKRAV